MKAICLIISCLFFFESFSQISSNVNKEDLYPKQKTKKGKDSRTNIIIIESLDTLRFDIHRKCLIKENKRLQGSFFLQKNTVFIKFTSEKKTLLVMKLNIKRVVNDSIQVRDIDNPSAIDHLEVYKIFYTEPKSLTIVQYRYTKEFTYLRKTISKLLTE